MNEDNGLNRNSDRVEGPMSTYEVFLRPGGRDGYAHAGSLDAPTDELALIYARETYIRRGEGESAWVVRRDCMLRIDSGDLLSPGSRPHAVNDGKSLIEHRKSAREAFKDARSRPAGDEREQSAK